MHQYFSLLLLRYDSPRELISLQGGEEGIEEQHL
jgi:hypothetical protein